jgi:hypothetical protein
VPLRSVENYVDGQQTTTTHEETVDEHLDSFGGEWCKGTNGLSYGHYHET